MAAVAGLLEQQGRNAAAGKVYRRMLEVDPENTVARSGMSRVGLPSDRTGQSRSEMVASTGIVRIGDEVVQTTADRNAAPELVVEQTYAAQSQGYAQLNLTDAVADSRRNAEPGIAPDFYAAVPSAPTQDGGRNTERDLVSGFAPTVPPAQAQDASRNAEPKIAPGVAPTVPSALTQDGGRNAEPGVVPANHHSLSTPAVGRVTDFITSPPIPVKRPTVLTEVLREGAQRLLVETVQREVGHATDSIITPPIPVKRPDILTEVLREGAQRLLLEAVQREIAQRTTQSDASANESSRPGDVQKKHPVETIDVAKPKATTVSEFDPWHELSPEVKSVR